MRKVGCIRPKNAALRLYATVVSILFLSLLFYTIRAQFGCDGMTDNLPAASFLPPDPTDPSKPRCNFQTFRNVSSRTPGGYINGSGTWKRRKGTNVVERFSPSICRLCYDKWVPPDLLATCLKREKVRYIAIIGDSNGRGYFHALHRLLNATVPLFGAGNCKQFKRTVDLTYDFYTSPEALIKHRCPCGGFCTVEFTGDAKDVHCYVLQAQCDVRLGRNNETTRVYIEYITSWWTLDYRIQYTNNTGCQKSNTSKVEVWSNTTQVFLLGEFFSNPKPDLLLVFSNTHDAMELPQLAVSVDAFSRIIDEFVGPLTRLVWASRHAEDDKKKPEPFRSQRFKETIGNLARNLTRLEWLDAANRILYDKMKDKFVGGNWPLLFPDLLEMSKPVLTELNTDGVHMRPDWYQFVMSFLLQSLCDVSCPPGAECHLGYMKHLENMRILGA